MNIYKCWVIHDKPVNCGWRCHTWKTFLLVNIQLAPSNNILNTTAVAQISLISFQLFPEVNQLTLSYPIPLHLLSHQPTSCPLLRPYKSPDYIFFIHGRESYDKHKMSILVSSCSKMLGVIILLVDPWPVTETEHSDTGQYVLLKDSSIVLRFHCVLHRLNPPITRCSKAATKHIPPPCVTLGTVFFSWKLHLVICRLVTCQNALVWTHLPKNLLPDA